MRQIPFILALCTIGCGTTQHFVPPTPPPVGTWETRATIGFSTGDFSSLALQLGGYLGLSSQSAFGFDCAAIFLPNSLSYVHYWYQPERNWNAQFHLNNILGASNNPTYELNISVATNQDSDSHALTAGIGLCSGPFAARFFDRPSPDPTLVPILKYRFQRFTTVAEMSMTYGLSRYLVQWNRSINSDSLDTNHLGYDTFQSASFPHNSVTNLQEIRERLLSPGWLIGIDSITTVVVASRDPYADCIGCSSRYNSFAAFPASPEHRAYWVWSVKGTTESNSIFAPHIAPRLMELNMKDILSRYNAGGEFTLREDADLLNRKLANIISGLVDLSFAVGYSNRQ